MLDSTALIPEPQLPLSLPLIFISPSASVNSAKSRVGLSVAGADAEYSNADMWYSPQMTVSRLRWSAFKGSER